MTIMTSMISPQNSISKLVYFGIVTVIPFLKCALVHMKDRNDPFIELIFNGIIPQRIPIRFEIKTRVLVLPKKVYLRPKPGL